MVLEKGCKDVEKTYIVVNPTAASNASSTSTADASTTTNDDDETGVITLEDLIGNMDHLECETGTVKVRGLDVSYWWYSNPKKPIGDRLPLVALHGGPSASHHYILPLVLLADMGYDVIFYDQCGCGASRNGIEDPKGTKYEYLLTVEYYVEEFYSIVEGLKLQAFYLYGSSWGSMLAQEIAVTRPKGLRGLILDGAFCDAKVYIDTQWRDRIGTLPSYTQQRLKKLTKEEKFDCKGYNAIKDILTTQFTVRQLPTPECFLESNRQTNNSIYVQMQGASEFTSGGVLKDWSIVDRLHKVNVPTLVVRGEFDTMTEEASQQIVDNVKYALPLVCIARAAHCKLCDEPQLCCETFYKFLQTIDIKNI